MSWTYRHQPPATTRHLNKECLHIDRQLLTHLAPGAAVYLTVLMHLDDCARSVADSESADRYNGWFVADREAIRTASALGYKQQLSALKQLRELKVVHVKRKGMPSRSYIYLNVDQMQNLFGVTHGDLRKTDPE